MRDSALPSVQLVSKPDVKLDFDVTNLGPSGFGAVEVYFTTDDGANWTQLPIEPGMVLPPDPRNPHGSVQVRVPEDGRVYGYHLVALSKANRSKEKPHSGDAPHIRLERDTTPPTAQLSRTVVADPSQHDVVILAWSASDKNLTDRPITLQWSRSKDGPWEFIGAPELPNTGRIAWRVPPMAPAGVFFKLTVRDGAGNVTVDQTNEAVVVDLSIPEVAGVRVSSGR